MTDDNDNGGKPSKTKQLLGLAAAIVLILVLTIFAMSIAILVKVYKKTDSPVNNVPSNNNPPNNNSPSNELNLPQPPKLDPQGDSKKVAAYNEVISFLKDGLNTSVNPCDDFYAYTCSARKGPTHFSLVQQNKIKFLIQSAKKEQTTNIGKRAARHFAACVDANKNPKKIHNDGQTIKDIYNDFKSSSGFEFPLFDGSSPKALPSNVRLSSALGYLLAQHEIATFMQYDVEKNANHPQDKGFNSYLFGIKDAKLMNDNAYYQKLWTSYKDQVQNQTIALLQEMASLLGISVDANALNDDVQKMLDLEYQIATTVNTVNVKDSGYKWKSLYNLYTLNDATKAFPVFEFQTFLDSVLKYASPKVRSTVVGKSDYQILVEFPEQLKSLNDLLTDETKVEPRTVYNYLFLRLLDGKKNLMPSNHASQFERQMQKLWQSKPMGNRRKTPKSNAPHQHPLELAAQDDSAIEDACAGESVGLFRYASTRLLIDVMLPSQEAQDAFVQQAATMAAKVIEGFRTQIDQLDWMQDSSKQEAYKKMKYLVKNIAFEKNVTDDTWMEQYHSQLSYDFNAEYLDILQAVSQFNQMKKFEYLLETNGTIRDDFGQSASIMNAWYQFDLNSITIPLGILQKPMFNMDYPASVNFGSASFGHELVHGFDTTGVQFDAFGKVHTWLDSDSQKGFDTMADCVDKQYSGFTVAPNININGKQTLGENIADNGGMHALYNAFLSHQSLYGSDPRLPDSKLGNFSPDQLFFLAFARTWCDDKDENTVALVSLIDEHSPNQFRVKGTLQNFPAFRSAFNCPVNKGYTPAEHCEVWSSEVKVETGIPPDAVKDAPGKVNNIDAPPVENSPPYSAVANRLHAIINLTKAPCEDFYFYACGQYDQTTESPFVQAHKVVLQAASKVIDTPKADDDPSYLTKAKQYMSACKTYDPKDGSGLKSISNVLNQVLVQEFPTFAPKDSKINKLSLERLSSGIGAFSGRLNISLLLNIQVKPRRGGYTLDRPYGTFFDQPRLTFEQPWYTGKKANEVKKILKDNIVDLFTKYNQSSSTAATEAEIDADADAIVQYEFQLAKLMSNEYTRQLEYKATSLKNASKDIPSVKFDILMQALAVSLQLDDLGVQMTKDELIFESWDYFKKLSDELTELSKLDEGDSKLRVFYNYLYYRILNSSPQFQPDFKPTCSELVNYQLGPVFTRAAIDQLYESKAKFIEVQSKVSAMAGSIQNAFGSILESLSWMALSTRRKANEKIENLVKTIGASDFVLDDSKLTDYYEDLTYTDETKFDSMMLDVQLFMSRKQLKLLKKKGSVKREKEYERYFYPTVWPSQDLNSITFSLDILQPPIYSPDYPNALNFGQLGSLFGQALGHLFDSEGIQFDSQGHLSKWFDAESSKEYDTMVDCLKDQYSGFCEEANQCVKGDETINANLADNTALQITLNGFRSWMNANGQDPRLPDDTLQQFSNEQLFFLGYAQQFCPQTDLKSYSFGSILSPNKYRLQGSLSNSQNFRSIFNCPVNSAYAPESMCSIWTSDEQAESKPQQQIQPAPMNIPTKAPSNDDAFKQCAAQIEGAIDTRVDPCENFYGYVCNRLNADSYIEDATYGGIAKLIRTIEAVTTSDPRPAQQEKQYYEKCVDFLDNPSNVNEHAKYIRMIIDELETIVKFPLALGNPPETPKINIATLSQLLGYANGRYTGVMPIVKTSIGLYYNDEGVGDRLSLRRANFNGGSAASVAQLLTRYFTAVGVTVDKALVDAEAARLVAFEQLLQNGYDAADQGVIEMTIRTAASQFPRSIDLPKFLEAYAGDVPQVVELLKNDEYKLLIFSPNNFANTLARLDQAIKDPSIPDSTIWNYVFFTVIASKSQFLPASTSSEKFDRLGFLKKTLEDHHSQRQPEKHKFLPDFQINLDHPLLDRHGVTKSQMSCVYQNMANKMLLVNNYLFNRAIYPDDQVRIDTREKISALGETILVAQKTMFDQIDWLTSVGKKNVIEKLDLYARNILYANITFQIPDLEKHYELLKIEPGVSDYLESELYLSMFSRVEEKSQLLTKTKSRNDFGDTTEVNAYYSPLFNSMNILTAITQPPIFDVNFPKAWNYGILAFVFGHEVNHGFDPNGINYDGLGLRNPILDPVSHVTFNKIVKCLEDQYDGLCLDADHCVDGKNTIGENHADNAGIRAAFRALQAQLELHGEEERLPGRIASQLSSEQVFFVALTRFWCNPPDKDIDSYYWGDVHTPDPLRMWGVLQNFDGFRNAFNCPTGAKYAPEKTCTPWISDVDAYLGLPTKPTQLPNLNLPDPETAPNTNKEYKELSDMFTEAIDLSQSPCDSFYEYTCNNIGDTKSNVQKNNEQVAAVISKAIEDGLDATKPFYTKISNFYTQCKSVVIPDTPTITAFMTAINDKVPFVLFTKAPFTWLTDKQLGTVLGFLSGTQSVSTIIDPQVLRQYKDARKPNYVFNLGEPVLTQPSHFYEDSVKSFFKDQIIKQFTQILTIYNSLLEQRRQISVDEIRKAAESFYLIESTLATLLQSDDDRRDASKNEIFTTIGQLSTVSSAIDWTNFFNELLRGQPDAVTNRFGQRNEISISSPNLDSLLKAVLDGNPYKITGPSVANYLNFRVLWSLKHLLVLPQNDGTGELPIINDEATLQKYTCALETRLFGHLHSRVYVEASGVKDNAEQLKKDVAKMGNRIISSFRSQIQQSTWLDDTQRQNVLNKLNNVALNLLYNPLILDDTFITNYYASYAPTDNTWPQIVTALRKFLMDRKLALIVDQFSRENFTGISTWYTATYDPLSNSLSVPASIATKPYYDANYPISYNYGTLGAIIAHELSHSLDKFGIQFNNVGQVGNPLGNTNPQQFNDMVTCLIDQYNKLCPLPNPFQPKCVDGALTLNENFADNAGVQAAYAAYQDAIRFEGASPHFNGLLKQFNQDQIFFLSSVRNFCSEPESNQMTYARITSGLLNPPKERVQGALQNQKAFKSAFNCPANSKYVKEQVCNVWTSDVSDSPPQPNP